MTSFASGAGSGGDPGDGCRSNRVDGTQYLVASRVELAALEYPGKEANLEEDPHVVSIFAVGDGTDGRVEMHGTQNVYLSVGPPQLPPAHSESLEGAQIAVGEEQVIMFTRGLMREVDQTISMLPGTIEIDGGEGPVVIKSLSEIRLEAANGVSSISLTPEGIILQGPLIMIN